MAQERAVDAKLMDEQEDFYLAAFEAENAAKVQVSASEEKVSVAKEKIAQAEADIEEARADVGVAEAILEHSRVLLSYSTITSPYDGIVTKRNFFPGKEGLPGQGLFGGFIKSADQGGTIPLFTVEQNNEMRIVVQVPDRDVPYLSTKSMATIKIDALAGASSTINGKEFPVTRSADSEDRATRTMRIEIVVPNADGQ